MYLIKYENQCQHKLGTHVRTSYGARFPLPSVSNKNVPDSRFPILAMYEHDDPLSFAFSKWPMAKIPKFNKRRALNNISCSFSINFSLISHLLLIDSN